MWPLLGVAAVDDFDSHFWVSQILKVRSMLAVASSLPSGLNTAQVTSSVCPSNFFTSLPSAAFHTAAVLSLLAVASSLLSGLKAIQAMSPACAGNSRSFSPVAAFHRRTVLSLPTEARI